MNLVDNIFFYIFVLGWLGGVCFAVVTIISLFMDFIDKSKDHNERRRN